MLHQNYSVNTVTSVRAFLLLFGATGFLIGLRVSHRRATTHRGAEGERLARRARSHGGFLDIDQSLDAGFKPCFTKIGSMGANWLASHRVVGPLLSCVTNNAQSNRLLKLSSTQFDGLKLSRLRRRETECPMNPLCSPCPLCETQSAVCLFGF